MARKDSDEAGKRNDNETEEKNEKQTGERNNKEGLGGDWREWQGRT